MDNMYIDPLIIIIKAITMQLKTRLSFFSHQTNTHFSPLCVNFLALHSLLMKNALRHTQRGENSSR